MTSRLDRLFILLESGSSAVTRRAAAKQIGEVQKLYPHELHALLNRLIGYLHSSSWDTRIAAAQAVEAILHNVPEWKPELYAAASKKDIKTEAKELKAVKGEGWSSSAAAAAAAEQPGEDQSSCDRLEVSSTRSSSVNSIAAFDGERLLSFLEFNLEQVLHKGARLIGSEGMEFDDCCPDDAASAITKVGSAAERLSRQRALLNEKLGLSQASKLGVNLLDMITDEDMMRTSSVYNANDEKVPVEHILNIKSNANAGSLNGQPQQLSCREINRAKRKARQNSANVASSSATITPSPTLSRSYSAASSPNGDEPDKKKYKPSDQTISRQETYYSLNDPVPDVTGNWTDAIDWPLENFCARLYVDLFNPKWEVRHGAATGLRELINNHAAGAGKGMHMSREEMTENHNKWLEDAAVRLLCVLCLDRFGDFVSDQVVAPVRETCAQVLGTIVKEMLCEKVTEIVHILLKLIKQSEWEVRHGGLLGLKYVFVVREDLLQIYLPLAISDILVGLFDAVDDVGAVAASTLIPVATWLPRLLNAAQVSSIIKMLWDLLLDQDELTSACNSFMGLLAAILCLPNAVNWIQMEPMSTLVPRLWPFLSHSASSVRKSTLITLQTLTNNNNSNNTKTSAEAKLNASAVNEAVRTTSTATTTTAILTTPSTPTTPTTPTPTPTLSCAAEAMSFDSKKLRINFGVIEWQSKLLQEALRHIFQRILVEPLQEIQNLAKTVWLNLIDNADLSALLHAACPYVSSWICLAMQPPKLAFDPANLIYAPPAQTVPSGGGPEAPRRRIHRIGDDLGGAGNMALAVQKLFLGGSEATPLEVRERNFMRARIEAARVLGALSHYLVQPAPGVLYTAEVESPMDCYTKVLLGHLNSRSAVQRMVCALIVAFWAKADPAVRHASHKLQEKLRYCVMEYVYYDEVAVSFTRLLQEAHDFIATLKQYKIAINDFNNAKILTLDQIEAVATRLSEGLHSHPLKVKVLDMLEDRRRGLQRSFHQTSAEQSAYNVSTQAALAGALVCLHCLPEKLNPIIKPLMESIKREACELLQELSAEFLVHLMDQICDRNPSPNSKIFTNLCTLLKSDAEYTPKIIYTEKTFRETLQPVSASSDCIYYGVLSLSNQQNCLNHVGGRAGLPGGSSTAPPRGPGRPPLSETTTSSLAPAENASNNENPLATELEVKKCRIQRLGAACTIKKICQEFGSLVIQKIPILHSIMFTKIAQFIELFPDMNAVGDTAIDLLQTNDLVTSLQLIEIAAPALHESFRDELFKLLPHLGILVMHPLKAIRHLVARCIATFAEIDTCSTLDFVVNDMVLVLGRCEHVIQRQGAIETIDRVVDKLQIKIVPYIVFLVVPLLGCMSDPDESVRLLSTHCFATLIQLMPLDSRGAHCKSVIKSSELQERKTRDREFLDYLFAPKTIPDYKVPAKLSVELRSYQQAGVNWLWFLNKYNLHGILCDDMGLGKTLQTICILAGDHHQRSAEDAPPLPSLVVCPPTLTGHWVYEVDKFLQNSTLLRPLHYVGLPMGREKLRCRIGSCNLVVASYDTVRKDIDFFSTLNWNYCVLDEGHIIKNGKTKSSKAIKQLKAKHRLILSGTPIQNNVLELWSLFDFLMPGFLGTEKQFIARYSRPILASRDSKSSPKEQEAGVLAMEALHRQVLPFLLRRVKEDVLTDLPPKITQDLLCELSPLQERLYEDFSKSHLNSNIKDCLENIGGGRDAHSKTHIFHALRYLQNVCNHPKLVLTAKHPEFARISQELTQQQSSLNDIEHSAKLPALKQLLLDCGIGVQTETVSQHRALIFCQLKAMLDIVEKDLLRKHLPSVTYLRLDGSVPASLRQDIVNNFNADPSIDVLLLTTQVGGLGLNLTGADTVIFVEHDWNPMRDLQAMDRAHRIGQKKVVNVYRLITRKSLEEKIMGLQKFKILTANTVVSADNASMDTMATAQLFDLFDLNERENKNGSGSGERAAGTSAARPGQMSVNTIIENLPELWSEHQYDEEYDVSNFIQALRK